MTAEKAEIKAYGTPIRYATAADNLLPARDASGRVDHGRTVEPYISAMFYSSHSILSSPDKGALACLAFGGSQCETSWVSWRFLAV
jgi:hypothetical protein